MKKLLSHAGLGRALALAAIVALARQAMATDIVVTSSADSGNGTLRQAIQFNESLGGGNRIVFSNAVTGTITLTNTMANPLGELLITKDVTIAGPGASSLAISGNNAHRVLHLVSNANVNISGLTITGGYLSFGSIGGCGILQEDSGSLVLSNCSVSGNQAALSTGGGAIFAWGGTVLAAGCTVSGNSADRGGGIYVANGTFTAINCTVFGNLGASGGGGIYCSFSSLFLTNCTVSGNTTGPGGFGGGIGISSATATIRNSIVAGNLASGGSPDCQGNFTSLGFNLIGAGNGSTGWGALGDQLGTTTSPLNPSLGPLQDNGGSTFTMAPLIGSPAIDQGNRSGSPFDQRGRPRSFTNAYVSSIPFGGDRSDIGAYEVSPITLVVSNLNDSGPGSLRQTLASAAPVDGDFINFATNVTGTLLLTSGELFLTNKNVSILGPGAKRLAVDGNHNSRVFHIASGSVLISDLTITGGTNNTTPYSSFGGGIFNDTQTAGRLTVSNCAIIGNTAFHQGAGMANRGYLYVYNSLIASNTAFGGGYSSAQGGGIYNDNAAWIQNCTLSGNLATGGFAAGGGGVWSSSGLTLYFCTVANNTSTNSGNPYGGGVGSGNVDALTGLIDSIVANNTGGLAPDVSGPFPYSSFSLIGKTNGSTGLTNGVNDNYAGSTAAPLDPRLGPLRDNGGPTLTHALLPDSPALDRAIINYGGSDERDQRGAPRPFYLPSVPHPGITDGSDIGAFELGQPVLSIGQASGSVLVSWPAYYGDFTLKQNADLSTSNWQTPSQTVADDGTNKFIVVNPPAGNRSYRLSSP